MANVPFGRAYIGYRLHYIIFSLQGTANLFGVPADFYITITDIHDYFLSKYCLRSEIVLICNLSACFFRIIKAYALLNPIGFNHLILYFC